MKYWVYILIIFSTSAMSDFHSSLLEEESVETNPNQSKFESKTKDALLSIKAVEERADYFIFKFKNLTFGEYTDNLMYLAPAVTGNVELRANKFKIYYNHFQSKAGVKYKFKF